MKLTDFHAHIIPWADHGSSSVETSLSQLDMALKSGITTVVATPHFYPQQENAERFIARRNECFDILKEHLPDQHPEILLGAEVLICDNVEEMPGLDSLCIEGTRTLLLELPFTDFSDAYVYSVKTLVRRGYDVVLAHADRYDPDNIDRLISAGAKIQLNVDSLTCIFTPYHLRKWIDAKRVVALGTDIHGADKNAYKRFNKVVRRLRDDAEFIFASTLDFIYADEETSV